MFRFPVAAGVIIYQGAMVAVDTSGYIRPARAAVTTDTVIGMALEPADNSDGAAGDIFCKASVGCFRWGNNGTSVAIDDVGSVVYAVDDNSVDLSSGGTRSPAGYVVDVDDEGVWVQHNPIFPGGADGDLVAANNLSDVASVDTARQNLQVRECIRMRADDLIAANNGVYYFVYAGADNATIESIRTRLSAALATGNATLTFAISTDGVNFTNVTNGVVTITQAGSAIGDLDSATPTAARTLAPGNVLRVTVGGTNTGAAAADIGVSLSY